MILFSYHRPKCLLQNDQILLFGIETSKGGRTKVKDPAGIETSKCGQDNFGWFDSFCCNGGAKGPAEIETSKAEKIDYSLCCLFGLRFFASFVLHCCCLIVLVR